MQVDEIVKSVVVSGPEYSRLCRVDGAMKLIKGYLSSKDGQAVSVYDLLALIEGVEVE